MVEWVAGVGIIYAGLVYLFLNAWNHFKTDKKEEENDSDAWLSWMRHFCTVLAFAIGLIGATIASEVGYENTAAAPVQGALDTGVTVMSYVLWFVCGFYIIMIVRAMMKMVMDSYKKRTGQG